MTPEEFQRLLDDTTSQEDIVPQNYEQYGDLRIEWSYPEEKPMAWLRALRNKKLTESDWRASRDLPEMSQEWKDYRQALRDLPSNSNPTLSDNGELLGVEWPVPPSS